MMIKKRAMMIGRKCILTGRSPFRTSSSILPQRAFFVANCGTRFQHMSHSMISLIPSSSSSSSSSSCIQYAYYSSFSGARYDDELDQFEDMQEYYDTICEAMNEQNYQRAKDLLTLLENALDNVNIESFENSIEEEEEEHFITSLFFTRRNLASVHFNMDNWNEAIDYCDQIIAMESTLKRLNRLDDAFDDLNEVCRLKAEALSNRSEAGDLDKALRLLTFLIDRRLRKRIKSDTNRQHVLKYKKELGDQLLVRGLLLVSMNKLDEAMKDVNELLKMNPSPEGLLLKGRIQSMSSRYEEACTTLEQVLHRDVDLEIMKDALFIMISSRVSECKFNEAILLCNQLIDVNSSEAKAFMLRGHCYQKLNNCEYALIDYKACVALDPSLLVDIINEYGSILSRLLRHDELLQLSEQYITMLEPFMGKELIEWFKHRVKFDVLYNTGLYEKGYNYYIQNLQPLENDIGPAMLIDIWNLKIDLFIRVGRLSEAKELAELYVNHASDITDSEALFHALQSRAIVLAYLGQYEEAQNDIRRCEEIYSGMKSSLDMEPHICFQLSKAMVTSRNPNTRLDSLQMFERVLQMSHQYTFRNYAVDALETLIELESDNGLTDAASKHVHELLGLVPHETALRWKAQLESGQE